MAFNINMVLSTELPLSMICKLLHEESEDTKGVIRNRKSMKDRQLNCQKKKDEITNNDLQNIHIELKIE